MLLHSGLRPDCINQAATGLHAAPDTGCGGLRLDFEALLELGQRHRLAVKIALEFDAAGAGQQLVLLDCFHAFGQDSVTQVTAHQNDAVDQRGAGGIVDRILHET